MLMISSLPGAVWVGGVLEGITSQTAEAAAIGEEG
jgi:hypothetical protein